MRHPPWSSRPSGGRPWPCCGQLDAACANADDLAARRHRRRFDQHPDAEIITSFPGLGAADRRPGPGRDRRRPIPLRRRQRPQGLRRQRPDHPRQRQDHDRPAPAGQEPAPRRRRLRLGLLRPDRLTRRPRPLRPPQARRRPARRRPTQPVQPPPRLPAPLPAHRPAPTTKPSPSPPPPRKSPRQLDNLTASDVFTGCPARSGSRSGRRSAGAWPLAARRGTAGPGSGVLRAGRGGQRVQHAHDHLGALRRSGPRCSTPAPWNVVASRTARSAKSRSGSSSGSSARPLVHLRGQRGQLLQPPAPPGPRRQQSRRRPAAVLGELVGPLADSPATDSGTCPAASAASTAGWRRPAAPTRCGHGGALGDPGLVDQPGPRAVVRVRGVPLPGGERGQDRGPRRRADRVGPLQHPQAARLLLGRHRGGIGRRHVPHRGLQHLQRLIDAGRRHHAAHRGCATSSRCSRTGGRAPLPGLYAPGSAGHRLVRS